MDENKKNQDEIEIIDIKNATKKLKNFFNNKKIFNNTTLIIFLIIVCMFFALFYRSYTLNMPQTEVWAENTVNNYYLSQIEQQVNQEYPSLPQANKQELVNQRFSEIYEQEKQNMAASKQQLAAEFKEDYQNDEGQTYMLAIDPYHYLRKTENLIETGTVCDEVRDDECWDNHMKAPNGMSTEFDGHTLIQYLTYKVANTFNPGIPLLNSIYMLPAIIIMLGMIPAFFIIKKYAGVIGGFVAAMLVALHPYLLGRTPAGFVDTDVYGITMGLYLIWMIIEAFSARSYKMKALFAGLAGLATWVFKQTWGGGWFFTFDILLAVLIGMIIYQILKKSIDLHRAKKTKKHIHLFHSRVIRGTLLIVITYLVAVIIFLGLGTVLNALKSPITSSGFQNAAHSTLWPNVYTTVAELNMQSLSGIINALVSSSLGQLMMFLAFLAIPLSLIKKYDKKSWIYIICSAIIYLILTAKSVISKISPNFYITLIIITLLWGILLNLFKDSKERASILLPSILALLLVGSIFASTRGIRFVLLGINPFSLLIGLTMGMLFVRLSKAFHKLLEIPKLATKIGVIILICIVIINYASASHRTALSETPQMNDAWYESLTSIKENSDKNAIITSWWDFGHWFKAVADRPVTFCGASQNTPMAHWVGKSLSTDNEELSVGILRMLDCGSNDAFELLYKEIDNSALTNEILYKIVQLDREEAKEYLLEKGIEDSSANLILQKTHCVPPEAFYITSQDMVSKSGVWAHFGLWDFKKADLYKNGKKKDFENFSELASVYDYSEEQIETLFDQVQMLQNEKEANTWISPWPGYITTGTCTNNKTIIECKLNIKVGEQDSTVLILEKYVFNKEKQEGIGFIVGYRGNSKVAESNISVSKAVIEIDDELETFESNQGLDMGITIIGYKAVVSSPELTNSVFTRLFYFNGKYTNYFDKFSEKTTGVTNEKIIVWKIDWQGNSGIQLLNASIV